MRKSFSDYIFESYRKRKFKNVVMCLLLVVATVLALVPLFSVFSYVLKQGAPALNIAFFTELPKPDHAADALAVAICHANGAPMAAALQAASA